MKWMVPINRLDAVQMQVIEQIVSDGKGSHLVSGFAGSGKTIVLTHVIERLASAKSKKKRVCFATFTHALKDMVESGLSQRALESLKITTLDSLDDLEGTYDVLVADELQDAKAVHLQHLRSKGKTLVAAADFDQQIYRWSRPQAEVAALLDGADQHQLVQVHRVNFNVYEVATSVLPVASTRTDPLVRDDDERTGLIVGRSVKDEFDRVYEEARRVAQPEHPSAVLLPSNKLLEQFIDVIAATNGWGSGPALQSPNDDEGRYGAINRYLAKVKSGLQVFGSGSGEMAVSDRKSTVYLMTYHASKGLDFPNVFLPHLTGSTKLNPMVGVSDLEERRLFFVAATRAKQRLHLSYHGEPHRFLGEIDPGLLQKMTKRKRTY